MARQRKSLAGKSVNRELKPTAQPTQSKQKAVAYSVVVGEILGKNGQFPRAIMIETASPELCEVDLEHVDGTCRELKLQTMSTTHDILGGELKKAIFGSMVYPIPDQIKRVTMSTALKTIVFYE